MLKKINRTTALMIALISIAVTASAQEPTRRPPACRPTTTPPLEDGVYFLLVAKNHALVMDVDAGNNNRIHMMTGNGSKYQKFRFVRQGQTECYTIQALSLLGSYLTILLRSDDQGIVASSDQAATSLTYRWTLASSGPPNAFEVRNKWTNECIDADDNEMQPGGKIQALGCRGVVNQVWIFQRTTAKTARKKRLAQNRRTKL